ncbi:hydantoinase/oxoprolinase family protein [Haloterrigena alkaliphila]|uniref:hydantoinase/oxoprolinase family protein n=1 Tax=Haloterrigena alkaliphila TaxID=2816475 RepID=UPI001CFFFDD9|nr:hydantoinase/oxoprolinase family protein [Haloterrigena alkaliphila]UHQ95210.1 hydantoinase/oxoprolinase family protein [Haloterrigena alkaliphila]
MHTLGIDIGGTFTDFTLVDQRSGDVTVDKEPTTPANPAEGALTGASRILDENGVSFDDIDSVIHGTTLVSNTLIEGTGATTGLLTTAGIRDTLQLRRGSRYDMFDWEMEYPDPLVPRQRRLELNERLDDDGEVVEPLDREEVRERVGTLVEDHDIDSIAVSLLHSYESDVHERAVAEVIDDEYPDLNVSLSADVVPVIREYERTSTTVINAYVAPVVADYLSYLQSELQSEGFAGEVYMMTSSGGVVDVRTAKAEPVRLVESGPAAGVLASRIFGEKHGNDDVFSFDMGGTTAKGSIVEDGDIRMKYAADVARVHRFKEGSGYDLISPLIDLTEIGAGGGSIASVNDVGLVEVGPESAGSDPGPICYNQGGEEPTVTDASLLLGYLNPENFYGGRMDLAAEKTETVFAEELADPLEVSVTEAAWRVFEVVNENMATAFRRYAASRGIDTRGLSMTALGGAGPSHAFRVARKLGIDEVVCPYGAGVGSSIGLTEAPRMYEANSTSQAVLASLTAEDFRQQFESLREEAASVLERAGIDPDATEASLSLDMRHVDQGHEIKVPLEDCDIGDVTPDVALEAFERTYRETFNRETLEFPVEVLTYRLELREEAGTGETAQLTAPEGGSAEPDSRDVYFGPDYGTVATDVYHWDGLDAGRTVDGPVVVEADQTTVVADPDSTLTVADDYDITIEL